MAKTVNLTIDGKAVSVPEGTLIVDAAKKMGIDIPVFCYHPKMEPVGMCRMCLVDVGRPVIDRATGRPILEEEWLPQDPIRSKTGNRLYGSGERGHGCSGNERKGSRR